MKSLFRMVGLAAATVTTALAATVVAAPTAALAAPSTPSFSSRIDGYAAYDGQDTCDPTAKPGVVGFKDLVNETYGSHTWGIGRDCGSGGTSEHKEGRALDYHFNYYDAGQRADATDLLNWLLATDSYGNRHAMARRLGMMYIIWNNKIWKAYEPSAGWQTYSGSNPHTDHIHFSFSWAGAQKRTSWWSADHVAGNASVYGVLPDGRMTYSVIDAGTGDRTFGPVISTATLGFTPKAMATMNFNTILVTSTAGKLYRVDVRTNNESLTFDAPVEIGAKGWTSDLLAYDGAGNLFGIADGQLRRYGVTVGTHSVTINSNTLIGSGFTLNTLTATGTNWILGTTSTGTLRSYRINGPGDWDPATLDPDGWGFTHLMSPGGGIYFGRTSSGGMYHYHDVNPYDLNGSDVQYHLSDPVDASGWTQVLLSTQPRTVS
ncbi:M23 family peptidase [Micromonospora echinaurantiaca]|uniref:M23 family peptidase n=1 Tax=Micromonospora echinaurantiaca TaxID=47857 RepID=UPI0037B302E5